MINKDEFKVSIIIPVYNAERYLKRCLDSVISQSYKNVEIIIINDGSTDNSANIIKEYAKNDSRINYYDIKNSGVSNARNLGIEKSMGDYISFVDADDSIEESMIEELVTASIKNKCDIVRCNYILRYNDKKTIIGSLSKFSDDKLLKEEIQKTIVLEILNGGLPTYTCLLLIKRGLLLDKKVKFSIDISYMEDVIFYLDLLLNCTYFYMLDKPLYNYYYNESGTTNSISRTNKNLDNLIVVNRKIKEILANKELLNTNIEKVLDTFHSKIVINYLFHIIKENNKVEDNEIRKYFEKEEIKNIIKNSRFELKPIHVTLPLLMAKKHLYILCGLLLKIRLIFSKLKGNNYTS